MKWQDSGILLSLKKFGESSLILSVFCQENGKYLGILKPTKSSRNSFQVGNFLAASWSARLSEHLGRWSVETTWVPSSFFLSEPVKLSLLSSACSLTNQLLPERHPYLLLYEKLKALIQTIQKISSSLDIMAAYVRYEVLLLQELGFGMDLSKCIATGSTSELIYVSPKSGAAVSRRAGLPYHDKMLPLPSFLLTGDSPHSREEVTDALKLTGFFLNQHLSGRYGLPPIRDHLSRYI